MVTSGSLRLYWRPMMLLLALVAGNVVVASEPPSTDMIRERIEAIGIRSLRSADGHIVVSGPNSFENARLLAWAGEVRERVESVVGLPLRFDARSVRFLVSPDDTNRVALLLEHEYSAGLWIQRLVLRDYAAIQPREGLESICAAFLALYIKPGESDHGLGRFSVPSWLYQGVAQVLTAENRDVTLDKAMGLWREGRLPPLLQIMSDRSAPGPEDDEASRLLPARGALVLWLTGMASDQNTLTGLFGSLAEGRETNREWLRKQLAAEGGDPDELWDRWILSQRQVVRSLGRLTLAHLDALQAAWYVQPGIDGIPWDIALPSGADCMNLLPYRAQPWFSGVIRQKRYQIEMLAQGRPRRFHELTGAYVDVLNAIESGERPESVVGIAVMARRQWSRLHETVQQAGGAWSEH